MLEEPVSFARLRHIGKVLRGFRDDAFLTQATAARRMERSGASLSLIEKGQQLLRLRDLEHILRVYGLGETDQVRGDLMELCRQQLEGGWWTSFKDVLSPAALDYASLEASASRFDSFETTLIPGPLQIEEYARLIIPTNTAKPGRTARFVAFRMARQQMLRVAGFPACFVVEETAIRRPLGGADVMRKQLRYLLSDEIRHIKLQVVPVDCGEHPGVGGPFTLLEIGQPKIFGLVFIDQLIARTILEDSVGVGRYRAAMDHIRSIALSEADSRDLISSVASSL